MADKRVSSKEVRDFLAAMEKEGWEFDGFAQNGHVRVRHGEAGVKAFLPATPSDRRSLMNCRAKMRRAIQAKMSQQKVIAH